MPEADFYIDRHMDTGRIMMDYVQPQRKSSFSVLKLIGLLIAIGGFIYKAVFAVTYFEDIYEWWSRLILLYFLLYSTSIITIASSLLKGTASLVMSIVVIALSWTLLLADGISYLGFAASLNDTPMIQLGITPLVNVLNMIAGVFILIGAIRSRR